MAWDTTTKGVAMIVIGTKRQQDYIWGIQTKEYGWNGAKGTYWSTTNSTHLSREDARQAARVLREENGEETRVVKYVLGGVK